jgi:hypothetical protein
MNLKTISYRNGLLQFRIPDSWKEGADSDGGGKYSGTEPDAGIFRVSLTTGDAAAGKNVNEIARSVLESYATQYGTTVRDLPSGVSMVAFDKPATENGRELVIRFWYLAHILPPKHLRIADFSYTLAAHQMDDPRFVAERALLDQEVANAQFHSNIGEIKKAWWRLW